MLTKIHSKEQIVKKFAKIKCLVLNVFFYIVVSKVKHKTEERNIFRNHSVNNKVKKWTKLYKVLIGNFCWRNSKRKRWWSLKSQHNIETLKWILPKIKLCNDWISKQQFGTSTKKWIHLMIIKKNTKELHKCWTWTVLN